MSLKMRSEMGQCQGGRSAGTKPKGDNNAIPNYHAKPL